MATTVGGVRIEITGDNTPFNRSITEEVLPRVQQMFAAQARELPRIIDSRVKDSSRRGRY